MPGPFCNTIAGLAISIEAEALRSMCKDNDPDVPCEQQLEASKQENRELREENDQLAKSSNDFGLLAERLNTERRHERRRGQPDRRRWPRIGAATRRVSQQAT
jgi:hypothetical protein